MSEPLLWHFPISHYNEKVRWALDWKRVPHRRVVLSASYLWRARRATGRATLPVLQLDGRAIGDSTAIIAALEARYPDPPLYPRDAALRRRALELEDWFDEEIGHPVRTLVVPALMEQGGAARTADVMMRGMHPGVRRFFRVVHPLFRRFYYARHGIDAASRAAAARIVKSGFERVAREAVRSGYLAGDAFSVADLTAASLLAPIVRPRGSIWAEIGDYPEPVELLILELRGTPAYRWVDEMYRRHRGESAEIQSQERKERTMRSHALTLLLSVLVASAALACREEGPAENAGRAIDEAGEEATEALDDAAGAVEDAAEEAREKAREAVE